VILLLLVVVVKVVMMLELAWMVRKGSWTTWRRTRTVRRFEETR